MIPLRATDLKLSQKWPKHIIIHHTIEQITNVSSQKFDTTRFQAGQYNERLYKIEQQKVSRYHFIVERIDKDFEIIVNQPLFTLSEWDDLDEKYSKAVHVALLGDYNHDIPPNRLYLVLAFRLLIPLMRLFYLKEEDILLHKYISNNPEENCPGEFVDMLKLRMAVRKVRRRAAIYRSK